MLGNLRPITASEIEFYLHGSDNIDDLEAFWNMVRAVCEAVDIPIFNIEKERGKEQHEVSICPASPQKTISDTIALKEIITQAASKRNMQADFSAKPFADDYGSGLHIHIHLEDENGKNQFHKDDAIISEALNYALGGLLSKMPEDMKIFAPTHASYDRFIAGNNAPTTISWGANNRTTALRLPNSPKNNKRIEHRVAGADADIEEVINAIISAINYGIEHKIKPSEQIYGDASLEMYKLPKLMISSEQ